MVLIRRCWIQTHRRHFVAKYEIYQKNVRCRFLHWWENILHVGFISNRACFLALCCSRRSTRIPFGCHFGNPAENMLLVAGVSLLICALLPDCYSASNFSKKRKSVEIYYQLHRSDKRDGALPEGKVKMRTEEVFVEPVFSFPFLLLQLKSLHARLQVFSQKMLKSHL